MGTAKYSKVLVLRNYVQYISIHFRCEGNFLFVHEPSYELNRVADSDPDILILTRVVVDAANTMGYGLNITSSYLAGRTRYRTLLLHLTAEAFDVSITNKYPSTTFTFGHRI